MGEESGAQKKIFLDQGSRHDTTLFRNNVGVAIYEDGRRVRYGLCVGSSDLIGWKTIEITPDMVGEKVAVFTALETKSKKGKAQEKQKNFIRAVLESGGLAGIARTVDDARKITKG